MCRRSWIVGSSESNRRMMVYGNQYDNWLQSDAAFEEYHGLDQDEDLEDRKDRDADRWYEEIRDGYREDPYK
jgi:hypothetical protein